MASSDTRTRPTTSDGDRSGGDGGRIRRRIPRSLSAAAHVTAAGIWTFVAAASLLALWGSTLNGLEDLMSWLLFVLIGLPVLGTAFGVGLAVAFVGASVTLPLAVVWFRSPDREGNGGPAIAHLAIATVVGAYVLIRVIT